MSSAPTTGVVIERIKHHLTILLILLLVPLFVSFIIWIVGSAFAMGGGVAPGVFYGIKPITSAPNYTIPSGVAYLWIASPANGGIASSPAFPSIAITIINGLLYVIAIGGAIFEGFELIVALASAQTRYSY